MQPHVRGLQVILAQENFQYGLSFRTQALALQLAIILCVVCALDMHKRTLCACRILCSLAGSVFVLLGAPAPLPLLLLLPLTLVTPDPRATRSNGWVPFLASALVSLLCLVLCGSSEGTQAREHTQISARRS